MAKTRNYINNKDLYENMVAYKALLVEAEKAGQIRPQVPNYIGKAIELICKNLAKKPNFSGYTYKEDMIGDGIIDCISAVSNFDPERTNNPFAYFTQIAWNAFLRRIQKEKKQTYIKHKNFENSFLMTEYADGDYGLQMATNEYSSEIVRSYENKLTKPKKPSKLCGVENFLGEEK
jgi:DNA-directed RNA polymerase specialized sigma subunit